VSVAEARLHVLLIPIALSIGACRRATLTGSTVCIEMLIDKDIKCHVGGTASPVAEIDPQLSQSQFGVLSVSMHHL
jgi:hypothetical protein